MNKILGRISIGTLIFLFFFILYTLTMRGHLRFGDEAERYLSAQSLVERHDLAIQFDMDLHRHIALNGQNYSAYELGSILPLVPFYALGHVVASFFQNSSANDIETLVTGLTNPFLTALTCALLYEFALALGYSTFVTLFITCLYGMATIAWPYSTAFEREPVLAFCLLLAAYASFRFHQLDQTRWLWIAGFGLGFLFFAKIAEVVLFPIFFIYLAWEILSFSKKSGGTPLSPRWLAFLLPIVSLVAVQAFWNYIRYGDWMDIGLKSTWGDPVKFFQLSSLSEGLNLFLYQPNKSIFIFSPPLLLFIPGWIAFFDKRKREALLFGITILCSILFYSTKFDPGQVAWWGPKYLVFITPIAILPIGALLAIDNSRWCRLWGVLAWLTGSVGMAVQLVGVLVDDRQYADLSTNGIDILGAIGFLRNGIIDSLVIYLSPVGQWIQINTYAIVMLVVAIGLVISIFRMASQKSETHKLSLAWNIAILVLVLSVQFASLVAWVVAPYRQVQVEKANTNFVAGNLLLANGDKCKASQLYQMALGGGTDYENVAIAQISEILPRAQGEPIDFDTMTDQIEQNGNATVQLDRVTALSEEGSIKITVGNQSNDRATAVSSSIPIEGNQVYELGGWIKTQTRVAGGSAAFVLYEDNGNWGKPRNTDIALVDAESQDWIPFWKTVTTLPTSKRVIVKASFGGTQGSAWFDRLQIAKISDDNPQSITPESCSQTH